MAAQQLEQSSTGCESNVLIAMDCSQISENAFKWYMRTFWRPNHKIHVCHVPEYWGDINHMMSPARLMELVEETKVATEKLQAKVDSICKDFNVEGTFEIERGQDAWHEVCKHAQKIKADVIVIGTRGMGMVKRTILGSVSESVLHHSHCPVLVYKDK